MSDEGPSVGAAAARKMPRHQKQKRKKCKGVVKSVFDSIFHGKKGVKFTRILDLRKKYKL